MIEDNTVADTRPDLESSDLGLHGHAIVSHFYATARVEDNLLEQNASDMHAYSDGKIRPR